jgi:hypothetical protein
MKFILIIPPKKIESSNNESAGRIADGHDIHVAH